MGRYRPALLSQATSLPALSCATVPTHSTGVSVARVADGLACVALRCLYASVHVHWVLLVQRFSTERMPQTEPAGAADCRVTHAAMPPLRTASTPLRSALLWC